MITENRRARYEYAFLETVEAGLALLGSEVKSMRAGQAHLNEAYVVVRGGEAWLVGAHVAPYSHASRQGSHDPTRERKLLLHRREIDRLGSRVAEKGLTLVPYRLYFKDGKAKCAIALAKGKATYDKREAIARRDEAREVDRALAARRRTAG